MKKLMLALVALLGLAAFQAEAGYRRCYQRSNCNPCKVVETCAAPCTETCNVDKIVEAPCPDVPCCVRYVKVEEPAIITKHISYSWDCPTGCTPAQQAAGMMKAGEQGTFSAGSAKGSY